jgi:putative MATE family efflux protein
MDEPSNRLGTQKVGTLLFKLSTPAVIGMLVQALYNIVDTIFVGRSVGFMGIAGISIVFPIYLIMIAFCQIIGIGGASIISRSLGAGNKEKAVKTLGNIFTMVLIISIIITIFGSIYIVPILRLFGATETILPYSVEYLSIILIGTIFFTYAMACNNVVRAEGNAKIAMYTMLISAGLNIILDPILIFGFNMGVKGAAIATVFSQAVTALYLVYYFHWGKSTLRTKIKDFYLDYTIVKETFAVGISSFVRQVAGSVTVIIVNNILAVYGGDITIAVYGVINKLITFAYMIMFGVVQGMLPIVGYNYGARQLGRVKKAIQLALITTTILSTAIFLLLMIIPHALFGVFSQDQELIEIGVKAIRVIGIGIPLLGFQIVGSSIFQGIGKALPALILTMTRQLLILIPLVLILPMFFQLKGVWMSFPIADILSFIITFAIVMKQMREFNIHRKVTLNKLETKIELSGE